MRSVVLAYGARTQALLVYRDLVERCARRVPSIDVSYFIESGPTEAAADGNGRALPGRVAVAPIWTRVRHPDDAHFYVAGPPAMLQTISAELGSRGVAQERVHVDAWE